MSQRVAILAGAGGELGRVTAQKLADAGFTVVGIDRNEDGLKQLPEGIRYEVGDPTDPAVARSLLDRIAVQVGPPEVLVNTIGTYHLGESLTATPELAAAHEKEIMATVDRELGAIGRPAKVCFVTVLPKTRSGKLLRRSIQAICEGRDPGDLTTIEDPGALEQIRGALRG